MLTLQNKAYKRCGKQDKAKECLQSMFVSLW